MWPRKGDQSAYRNEACRDGCTKTPQSASYPATSDDSASQDQRQSRRAAHAAEGPATGVQLLHDGREEATGGNTIGEMGQKVMCFLGKVERGPPTTLSSLTHSISPKLA